MCTRVAAKRRTALGSNLIAVARVGIRHLRAIFVSQHVEHAIECERPACIDVRDAASGDGRGDNTGVDEIGSAEFASVLCGAGDLCASINARGGGADIRCHDAHRTFLLDCTCGVLFAAWVMVRMMARRARSILKALCEKPLAPRSAISAACAKASGVAALPRNEASASALRQGRSEERRVGKECR